METIESKSVDKTNLDQTIFSEMISQNKADDQNNLQSHKSMYNHHDYFSFKNSIPHTEKKKFFDYCHENERLNTDPCHSQENLGLEDCKETPEQTFDSDYSIDKFNDFLHNQMIAIQNIIPNEFVAEDSECDNPNDGQVEVEFENFASNVIETERKTFDTIIEEAESNESSFFVSKLSF